MKQAPKTAKVSAKPLDDDEAQDKYDTMRDENLQLKTRHKQLEESIKIIAVKLKRQVSQLKSDRAQKLPSNFDTNLDKLIED